jgi:histidyl-tRNA synthetase
VYERYGFEPLETPAFENIETLLGKYGEEGNKLIFKILRRGEHEASGEADLALRYDLTVPLARVVAHYQNELPKFFKRYQIQPVWRADRPARGRFREFYQCDIDTVGSTSPLVEVEQIAAVSEVLTRLGFEGFDIRINHRHLLTLILEVFLGIPKARHAEALVLLDKLDKIGSEGVAQEMAQRQLLDSKAALEGLKRALLEERKPLEDIDVAESWSKFDKLEELFRDAAVAAGDSIDLRSMVNVRQIRQLCLATPAANRLRFDPSLARGLSYYTGAIMEIAVPDLAGSLGGGGRYDNLIGMFLGRDVPACGFSLGLERIIVVMTERNMFPATVIGGGVDVMVTLWNEQTRADSLALASEFRAAGLRVDLYPEADKLGKQFKYASGRNVPFVAILGDDERAQGKVSIKDLRSGEQQTIARGDAGQYVATRRQ